MEKKKKKKDQSIPNGDELGRVGAFCFVYTPSRDLKRELWKEKLFHFQKNVNSPFKDLLGGWKL